MDVLKNSKDMLDVILGQIGTGVIIYDADDGSELFANTAAVNNGEMKRTTQWIEDEQRYLLLKDHVDGTKFEHFDAESGIWFEIKLFFVDWIDGRQAIMCVETDITLRKKNRQRIEYQSHNDTLTGLYNRKKREDDVRTVTAECLKNGTKAALIAMDLDDFKVFNESLGQQFGDSLLQQISIGLQSVPGTRNHCYRAGGDEISVIVVPELVEHLDRIIKNIMKIFNEPWFVRGNEYFCTASLGIALIPDDSDDPNEIIKMSEMALASSKTNGKNIYTYYDKQIFDDKTQRIDIESSLRQSVVNGMSGFSLNFQPVTDIRDNKCSSCEALLRWSSKTLGNVGPAEFISIAESTGLITEIGAYVFEKACKQCKEWNEKYDDSFKINVNVSVVQLMQKEILNEIQGIIMSTGVNPANIVVEITESFAITDMKRMMNIVNGIKRMGMSIALDDFGTGYSSLSYIKELPLDIIKVDKTFIDEIVKDDYAKAFVHTIVELSNSIGTSVVVEGVEDMKQLEILRSQGVNYIQGYLLGKPVGSDDFVDKHLK